MRVAVLLVGGLLFAAVPASFADTAIGSARTSFTEPGARPQNPVLGRSLPEPDFPAAPEPGPRAAFGAATLSGPAVVLANYDTVTIDPGSSDTVPLRLPWIDDDPAPESPVPDLRVEERWPAAARAADSVVAGAQVVAYYGHPFSRFMGVLGENPIEVMTEQLRARAAEYDAINGELGVAPAFHIIYGTVWEDANVGILREPKLLEYIEYALENDLLVFLDHQIGKGTVEDAIRSMLPYLRYENVHLAIDPEWATDVPGQEIGGVHAEDINNAQRLMQDHLEREGLPGTRMLVVHQFNYRMIEERELVRSDFPRVQLIHHADGFGSPPQKIDSFRFNAIAGNMPLKGFKLFYPKSWRDGGYDIPLMSPAEVMQLEPVPVYIQYQ